MGNKNGDKLFNGTRGNPQISLEQEEFASNNNGDIKKGSTLAVNEINKNTNVRTNLLNSAKTREVKELIERLYRLNATIGDGGTADALRYEINTGINIGNKSHRRKAKERINQINNILKKNPNHPDKELLKKLKDDLQDAMNTKKGDK